MRDGAHLILVVLGAVLCSQGYALSQEDTWALIYGPFRTFPDIDNCGHRYNGTSSRNACPENTCPAERAACFKADDARKACKVNKCSIEALQAATNQAKAVCQAASDCVKSTCYASTPAGGKGGCKVRSFHTGLCCCATCPPPPGAESLDSAFKFQPWDWPPSAVALEGGLKLGQVASINGKVDLSSYCGGPAGAAIFGVSLEEAKDNPDAQYQVVIDYVGPQGVYVPDWYFLWWDKLGQDFQVMVESNRGREKAAFGYNSADPTITKFGLFIGRT